VNNAGISVEKRGDLLETKPESFDRLMRVNLRGPFFLTQRVAAAFVADPRTDRYRSIINISSANAFAASINRGEYRLSKIAVTMATWLFAVRLGEAGIGVFEIRPGVIRTEIAPAHAFDRTALVNMPVATLFGEWGYLVLFSRQGRRSVMAATRSKTK
jgi:NAD(P)-dependent dehydrogenase (short-subunit alcohol dehydrogenase family)